MTMTFKIGKEITSRRDLCELLGDTKPRKELQLTSLKSGEPVEVVEVDSREQVAYIDKALFDRMYQDGMLHKKATLNGKLRYRLADGV